MHTLCPFLHRLRIDLFVTFPVFQLLAFIPFCYRVISSTRFEGTCYKRFPNVFMALGQDGLFFQIELL